jgi:hypothetical protein
MQAIEHTYIGLLADVSRLTGVPSIGRSAYDGLEWCIFDAPKLEKELLDYIENGSDFSESWPLWLRPLRDLFIKGQNPFVLRWLRQLLLFCYKAAHALDNDTYKTFAKQWVRVQAETSLYSPDSMSGLCKEVLCRARAHCTASLTSVSWENIVPYHGPGAVYDSNWNKGRWSQWFATIEAAYPYSKYFYLPGVAHWISNPLEPHQIKDEIHARLIAVPKDARGPRLICVHPTESIWIQEGLRDQLETSITRRFIHPWNWPKGQVHFDDQTPNGRLALQASMDRTYATLDLKEASDRLSDTLVRELFGSHYRWFGSCRAQKADIPVLDRTVEISCYAPMGNATTFPVQSLVFWALCASTLEAIGCTDRLLVFGDDIIVPSAHAPLVIEVLEQFGLRVNRTKSFYKGAFRESCGVDAFNGINVTPTRWKTDYDPSFPAGLMAASSIAMNLRRSGYLESSIELYAWIRNVLKKDYGKELPISNNKEHGGICEYVPRRYSASAWDCAYWHRSYQRFVTPCLRLRERNSSFRHGWNHVLTSLTSLERTGRSNDPANSPSRRMLLNRGWTDLL